MDVDTTYTNTTTPNTTASRYKSMTEVFPYSPPHIIISQLHRHSTIPCFQSQRDTAPRYDAHPFRSTRTRRSTPHTLLPSTPVIHVIYHATRASSLNLHSVSQCVFILHCIGHHDRLHVISRLSTLVLTDSLSVPHNDTQVHTYIAIHSLSF